MMDQIIQMVINKMMNDPKMQEKINNSPLAQEYLNVIRNNDSQRGIEIANGLINTYGNGMNQQQCVNQAVQFFQKQIQR